MILSRNEILKAIENKRIEINPFEEKNVGSCSVDFRLGNSFRVFKKKNHSLKIDNSFKISDDFSEKLELKKGEFFELHPGEFILGATHERLKVSNDLCARIEGRSTFARIGLLVHISSALIQPGSNNVQVLEIANLSPFTLKLYPETKICQIVFEELRGKSEYSGHFKVQKKP